MCGIEVARAAGSSLSGTALVECLATQGCASRLKPRRLRWALGLAPFGVGDPPTTRRTRLTSPLQHRHTDIMHRGLAILKYVPAALCGLLVVAWAVSWFAGWGFMANLPRYLIGSGFCEVTIGRSSISGYALVGPGYGAFPDWISVTYGHPTNINDFLGNSFYLTRNRVFRPGIAIEFGFPTPLILTTLMPFSIAPFTRFRFPLWSYFAWTALIAAELAYYLR